MFIYNVIERMFRTYVRGDWMTKYKVVNKRRFSLFLFIVLTMILLIVIVQFKSYKAYSSTYNNRYIQVFVKEGDTIWDIAIENIPERYDVRKMVFEIKELNNMKDVEIHPGDLIKIPFN